jgi:hypothetical protein
MAHQNERRPSAWSHSRLFSALVDRGYRTKDRLLLPPYYVAIYPQTINAAILYDETVKDPLHINHSRVNEAFWQQIRPHVTHVRSDNKGHGREGQNFDHYRVDDWDGLAKALGL